MANQCCDRDAEGAEILPRSAYLHDLSIAALAYEVLELNTCFGQVGYGGGRLWLIVIYKYNPSHKSVSHCDLQTKTGLFQQCLLIPAFLRLLISK